ncbi:MULTISPECIES: hypothetical protein [unclassified Janthinobacterium]|uniref:hypothetical protein n=1 Tax=unclassified Janthinobacterium TaxID=2610881 RepID=UPI0002FDF701|nr:hypothetical protein [Janthinobacterium sp. CG_23.4]MDH6159564.1 hypothetical protein [Janthinobacterium sp. CG_23.4]
MCRRTLSRDSGPSNLGKEFNSGAALRLNVSNALDKHDGQSICSTVFGNLLARRAT